MAVNSAELNIIFIIIVQSIIFIIQMVRTYYIKLCHHIHGLDIQSCNRHVCTSMGKPRYETNIINDVYYLQNYYYI